MRNLVIDSLDLSLIFYLKEILVERIKNIQVLI